MDRVTARRLMSEYLISMFRPDQQFLVTPQAKKLLDEDQDGKVTHSELLGGLTRDEVSFDPKIKEILANRSRMPIDASIKPKDRSRSFDSVEQCMEFVMRYFKEARAKAGRAGGSFDVDFGTQHNLAHEVRQMGAGQLKIPGYGAFLNDGITPPRAGDVLVAESPDGEEFHIALVTSIEPKGSQWEVSVYQANVPFNSNSPKVEDHVQKLPLKYENGRWSMPMLPTSRYKYASDMNVVGWIHPEGDKALPGAAA